MDQVASTQSTHTAASGAANRLWRLFATGLSFTVFGIGGVLLSVTFFPLVRLTSGNREVARRRIAAAMQLAMKAFVGLMRTTGLLTYEVRNRERLLQPGQLIVANHPTLIDVVFLISLVPQANCIVKQGLWRNPLLRWPVIWAGYIPNKTAGGDSAELIQRCASSLQSGRSLILFPEGTRSVPGQPLQLKRGAAQIALAAGVDVLPVTIDCTPLTLTKTESWHRIPPRRPHFTFHVDEPLSAAQYRPDEVSHPIAARRLTAWLASHFSRARI